MRLNGYALASHLENGRYRNLRKELEGHVALHNACNLFTTCGDSCIFGVHVLNIHEIVDGRYVERPCCMHAHQMDEPWYAGAGTLE